MGLTPSTFNSTEVCGAYKIALEHNGPSVLILSRQTLPNIEKSNIENIKYGATKEFFFGYVP